jgi:hypothetical protein
MEQLQQLIGILKETPSMALWGIGMFLGWRLLTLASWVSALAFTAKLLINRYFDYRKDEISNQERAVDKEIKLMQIKTYHEYIDESTYADTSCIKGLFNAISEMSGGGKLHKSDIRSATELIKQLNETEN